MARRGRAVSNTWFGIPVPDIAGRSPEMEYALALRSHKYAVLRVRKAELDLEKVIERLENARDDMSASHRRVESLKN